MRYGQDRVGGIALGRLRYDRNRERVTHVGAGDEARHAEADLAGLVVRMRLEVEGVANGEDFGGKQETDGERGNPQLTDFLTLVPVAFRGHCMT